MTLLVMVLAVSGVALPVTHAGSSVPTEDPPVPAAKRAPSTGDSLPEGAVARLGTLRFNHGSDLNGVAFANDGQSLVSAGSDGLIQHIDGLGFTRGPPSRGG